MIFILSPYGVKTGGTELLHQLCFVLKKQGVDATVIYDVPHKPVNATTGFENYGVEYMGFEDVQSSDEDVLVVPEVFIGHKKLLSNFTHARLAYWWLSVDNFLFQKSPKWLLSMCYYNPKLIKQLFKSLLFGKFLINYDEEIQQAEYQFVQSQYAREFLLNHGIENNDIFSLSDYVNDKFISDMDSYYADDRKEIVIYNPAKGIRVTKRLIQMTPDLKWVPIQGMSTSEVDKLLHTSSVYVDFGSHPGKDRIPREAAISGNCIITGRRGSAGNSVDVCIPEKYKFNEDTRSLKQAADTIRKVIRNYDAYISDFSDYRNKILNEKNQFFEDAKQMYRIISR